MSEQSPPAQTQPPASGITKEQASKILKADIANMVKKVASGRTLSTPERAILKSINEGDEDEIVATVPFVRNQVELAELLGVNRNTIRRWKEEDGCPISRADGRYCVADWKVFARSKGHEIEDDESSSGATGSQTKAKAEQLFLQNERLRYKIGLEKEKLIPKFVAQKIFGKLLIDAKSRCFSSVTRFVTLARISKNSEEAHEEIRKEMIAIWKSLEDSKWVK